MENFASDFRIKVIVWFSKKGYVLFPATSFGANFLAYSTEKLQKAARGEKVHSDYVVYCFDRKFQMSGREFILLNRVAKSVNKEALIVYPGVDSDSNELNVVKCSI